MRSIGLAFLISLISTVCFAQGSVNQTGSVVNGHAVRWFDDRTIGDAGPASGGNANVGITELAIVGKGLPFCIYDAPITNAAGYHSMCLGHTRDTFVFVFDGVEYEFPFVKGGMIGNSPSEVGAIMCFGNHQGTFAIKCGDPAPVTDPPNYGFITNLVVTGTLTTDTLAISGDGIQYTKHNANNKFAFSWDGTFIHGWVNGVDVGQLATTAWALNTFATQQWVLDQGYTTMALVQSWVNSQGFLKANDLTGYATQAWVLAQGYITAASLAPYATMDWVNSQGFVKGGPYMPATIDCGIGYERWPPVHPVGFSWDNAKLHVHVDCTDTPGTLATEQWVSANFSGGGGGMPLTGRDLIVHNKYNSGLGRNEMLIFQTTNPDYLYGEWRSFTWQFDEHPPGADVCLRLYQSDINGGGVGGGGAAFCTPYGSTAPGEVNFGVTGTISAVNFSPPSDTGIKKDVVPYTHGLAELKQLNTISFKYNGQGPTRDDGVTRQGIMAPDVEAVLPELVTKRKNINNPSDQTDYRFVDIPGFTWVLVNAVKELEARAVTAESKVRKLESRLKKAGIK